MKYSEAISKAIEENLSKGNLFIFGQDIRRWGGQGGVFKGMYDKFPKQVFDTPISEAATAGIATGMAMAGKHCLVEYAFLDFILHSTDNIINNASKIAYLSNGKFNVPLTYYATINSERGYGATHSQPLEYIFTKVPGLTVVYPSNSTDAYSLLSECLERNSPTLFLNHKLLHDQEMEWGSHTPMKARTVNDGDKLTIVSYGKSIPIIFDIVKELEGIELIDLRYLNPIDWDTIEESVKKTKNLLVIDEGYGAVAAEIIAHIAEMISGVRVSKLTSEFTSVGVAQRIEESANITAEKIRDKISEITQ